MHRPCNRNINPIETYKIRMAIYVSRTKNISYDKAYSAVTKMLEDKKDTFNKVIIKYNEKNEYENKEKKTNTLQGYIDIFLNSKMYTYAPSMTTYIRPEVMESVHADFQAVKKKQRGVVKEEGFKAKMAKDLPLFALKDTTQKAIKRNMNALSGAYVSPNVAQNTSAHYSLTSTVRATTSVANMHNEINLGGNLLLETPSKVISYILAVIEAFKGKEKEFDNLVNKYDLRIPNVEQFARWVEHITDNYYRDTKHKKYIRNFIGRLTDMDRAIAYYANSTKNLYFANPEIFKPLVASLIDTDSVAEPFWNSDRDVEITEEEFVLIHSMFYERLKGIRLYTHEDIYTKLDVTLQHNIHSFVHNLRRKNKEYKDIHEFFITTDVTVVGLARAKKMIRNTVAISDTDSTIFSLDIFNKWFYNRLRYDMASGVKITALFADRAQYAIGKHLRQLTNRLNVPEDRKSLLSYKSEMVWTYLLPASVAKTYICPTAIVESNPLPEVELEKKGVQIRSSLYTEETSKAIDTLALYINDTINNNKPLSIQKVLEHIKAHELKIKKAILDKNINYFKTINIKVAETYKAGADSNPIKYNDFYNETLGEIYGKGEPPYTAVKLPIRGMDNKTKLHAAAEIYKHNKAITNIIKTRMDNGYDYLGAIYIPYDILYNNPAILDDIYDILDLNKIIYEEARGLYVMLKSLGYLVRESKLLHQFHEDKPSGYHTEKAIAEATGIPYTEEPRPIITNTSKIEEVYNEYANKIKEI